MTHYKLNKGFITQKLDGKITIFDGEKSVLYTFNETASLFFQKLKSGKSKEEIVTRFVKKYGLEKKRAEKDINDLLKDLIAKKIFTKI